MKNKITLEEIEPGIYKIHNTSRSAGSLDFSEIANKISNPIKEKKKKFIYMYCVLSKHGEYVDVRGNNKYTRDIRHAMLWQFKEYCEITEPGEKIKRLKFMLGEE